MGVCHSNSLEDAYHCNNMIKQPSKKKDFVYQNALISFKYHENKFSYNWQQLASFSCTNAETCNISQPIPLNDRQILIIPQTIQPHIDLKEIPTFLYACDVETNAYSKITKYPTDFPKGRHTTVFDKNKGIIYLFTEKGYIVHYNINTKQWKWDIIHGIADYHSESFTNESCSVMLDHRLCVVTRRQHILWNQNNKHLQIYAPRIFHDSPHNNYVSIVYKKKQGVLLWIGDKDSLSYSLKDNHWMKCKLLKCRLSSFGCVLTKDERYVLIFGGIRRKNEYDDILIIDTESNFKVRKSKIKCPMKGAIFACNMVEDSAMDLMLSGLERKWYNGIKHNSSFDFVTVLKKFYCIEYVHLFHRNNGSHSKVQMDTILM